MPGEKGKFILCIDLGTSGSKTALVSTHGEVAGWEYQAVPLHLLPHGGAEQDPGDWWEAITATARRLLARVPVKREAIIAVCCSTQGEGTVPVDKEGRPLMNCITWMDSRGAGHLGNITGGLFTVAGYRIGRLWRWIRLTGGAPSQSGKDPAAHMLYIRDRFPEIYAKTYKFLNVLDYVNFRLTGKMAATYDSITTSWVTDNRDIDAVRYDRRLVRWSGIAPEKFPPLVRSTEILGPLKDDLAGELGLPRGIPVVAGSIDVSAAAVGSGAVGDYETHLCIGTSSWIIAHVPFKKTDLLHSIASIPSAVPGRYAMIGMTTTAGGNLTFLRDQIFFPADELSPAGPPDGALQAFDRLAAGVPAGSGKLLYAPWIYGERTPVDDSLLRAGLFNLSLEHTRSHLVRAFLEGVAYNHRWLLQYAEKFTGRELNPISMVGGGASSELWCRIHADVLNRTVRQVKDPIQANVRGAAFIAAAALGHITFAEIPHYIKYENIFEPDPANREIYDTLFHEFVKIYRQYRGLCGRLNRKR